MAFIDIFNFKKYFANPSDSQVARYGHVNALYDALSASSSSSAVNVPTPVTFSNMNNPTLNYNLLSYDITIPQKFLIKATFDGATLDWNSTANVAFLKFSIATNISDYSSVYIDHSFSMVCSAAPAEISQQRWTVFSQSVSDEGGLDIFVRPAAISPGSSPAIDTTTQILTGTTFMISLEIIPTA